MSESVNGVLGRYGDKPAQDEQPVDVVLLNFPLRLFESARERHDELMREFSLLALQEDLDEKPPPAKLRELVELLGRRYGAAGHRADAIRDAALDRGDLTADLTYQLPPSALPGLVNLHALMEQADEFCRSEQLLTLAATQIERDFRNWYLGQFIQQLGGAEARPWHGPLTDSAAL